MPITPTETPSPDIEDFRRLGVRTNEFRLSVIRSAAARSARSLADQQLASPSENIERQLSRVVTSAYRLMDPRLRANPHQRAYVGRILPNALNVAGRTRFFEDQADEGHAGSPSAFQAATVPPTVAEFDANAGDSDDESTDELWRISLSDDDLLSSSRSSRRTQRMRRRLLAPWLGFVLLGLLIGGVLGLVTLRRNARFVLIDAVPSVPVPTVAQSTADAATEATAEDGSSGGTQSPSTEASVKVVKDQSPSDPPATDLMPTESPQTESLQAETPHADTPGSAALEAAESVPSESEPSESESPDIPETDKVSLEPLPIGVMAAGPMPANATGDVGTSSLESPEPIETTELAGSGMANSVSTGSAMEAPGTEDSDLSAEADFLPDPFALGESVVLEMESVEPEPQIEAAGDDSDRVVTASETGETTEATVGIETPVVPSVDEDSILANAYVRLQADQNLPAEQDEYLRQGLVLFERLFASESWEAAGQVHRAMKRSVRLAGDLSLGDLVEKNADALKLAERLSQTYRRVIDREGTLSAVDTTVAEAPALGRYLCLFVRNWNDGLRFLASASDPKIARAARIELKMIERANFEPIPQDEWLELAERWEKLSEFSDGRARDSMRLHAAEIVQRILESAESREADSIELLDARRMVAGLQEQLPRHLVAQKWVTPGD